MTPPAGTTAVELDRCLTFGADSYPFTVCAGPGAWDDLAARLAALGADRFVLVVDTGVPPVVHQSILGCFRGLPPVTICEVAPGNKSPETVNWILRKALKDKITRQSVFVAAGGGEIGNLAGKAAADAFRGATRLFHVPTTLLAGSDSVISRKQAANCVDKNDVGAFKTPAGAWVNLDVLRYLPADEIRSALCEGAKNLVAVLPDRAPEFAGMFRPEADYTDGELTRFVAMCLDAKQPVMRDDPDEKGAALIFEEGHTAGHAAEELCGLRHGFAIGVGGLVAACVARTLGFPGAGRVKEMHEDLLRLIGAPVTVPRGVPDDIWLGKLLRDNKRGYRPIGDEDVEMVLLEEPGVPHYTGGLPLTQVPAAVVLQAIRDTEQAV
jgi:3-dehydroquinate synthetase